MELHPLTQAAFSYVLLYSIWEIALLPYDMETWCTFTEAIFPLLSVYAAQDTTNRLTLSLFPALPMLVLRNARDLKPSLALGNFFQKVNAVSGLTMMATFINPNLSLSLSLSSPGVL